MVLNRITETQRKLIDHTFRYVILDQPLFAERTGLESDFIEAKCDCENFDKNLRFDD